VLTIASELRSQDHKNRIDLGLIDFWWHQEVGKAATKVPINA